MCSHFETVLSPSILQENFGVAPDKTLTQKDIWPGTESYFIYKTVESKPTNRMMTGLFGLIPSWSSDQKIVRYTYNARYETIANKPSFREAWHRKQHCIIPVQAFYEPDWRSGKALSTALSRHDGKVMGLAGLWNCWKDNHSDLIFSFTMITINADNHPLLNKFHKVEEEKRMVVVLQENEYQNWLDADYRDRDSFLKPCNDELLVISSVMLQPQKAQKSLPLFDL
jgi:putative SOS response-associated peptidase YedK